MKAVVLTGIDQIQIQDVPKPSAKKDTDVLLKIEAVGVCGSDVHYYETGRIGSQVVEYPFTVGHECVATVEGVGSSVSELKVGEKVVVDPAISCGKCDQCQSARENTCRQLKFLGCPGQIEGCLCEYIVMPADNCYRISDNTTFGQGVLGEPLAIGVYAVEQSKADNDDEIAILGAGPIGLSCMVAARAAGIKRCHVTEKISERIKVASDNGADWVGNAESEDVVAGILQQSPNGVDIVYECSGDQEAIDQAVEILKPGGRLMLIGIPREQRISFVIDKMRRKEITLVNVRRQNNCTAKCMDMIATRQLDIDFMITHRFGIGQTQQAFDMVAGYKDGVVKALIEF